MPSVFISYQRTSSAMLAQLMVDKLRAYGISAYVDTRQREVATQFPDRLRKAIEDKDVFICLIAATTFEAKWVQDEIQHAVRLRKPIIPVFQESYKPVDPPTDEVAKLLEYDGVHIFDIKSEFVDEAILNIANMVKRTISQSSKKPITKMRSIVFGLTLLVIILISALIISSYRISPVEAEVGLAFIITDTPNDIATQESIMTRFVTETAVAFATESVRNRLATNEYAALQTSAALATASANNQTATIEFVVAQTDVALATSLQTTLNIELTDTQGTRIVLSATAMPSPTPNLSETRTAEARQQERALIDAQATVSVQQTQTVQAIPDSPQVIVDVSNANVRSGPGSDYSVVGSASQGHIFEAVAYYDDSSGTRWYQIAWDGVSQAWIQERVVTYASNSVSLALASSIPATPQNVVAATGSPNSDSIPSILSVSYDGTCIEHTTTIDWDDPDGDALRIELVDINNGSIYGSYSVQGKSGTAQYNSTCVSGVVSCFTNVRIVDHAGNVSPIFFSTLACTQ